MTLNQQLYLVKFQERKPLLFKAPPLGLCLLLEISLTLPGKSRRTPPSKTLTSTSSSPISKISWETCLTGSRLEGGRQQQYTDVDFERLCHLISECNGVSQLKTSHLNQPPKRFPSMPLAVAISKNVIRLQGYPLCGFGCMGEKKLCMVSKTTSKIYNLQDTHWCTALQSILHKNNPIVVSNN